MISIHALLAESDHYDNYNLHCVDISIHALLAESDLRRSASIWLDRYFYPRSPCGERPNTLLALRRCSTISIHALLAESDNNINSSVNTADQISIHALLAESDRFHAADISASRISIHALLAESDKPCERHASTQQEFLSTLSLRRATLATW